LLNDLSDGNGHVPVDLPACKPLDYIAAGVIPDTQLVYDGFGAMQNADLLEREREVDWDESHARRLVESPRLKSGS
jgi:hypothetical protein